MKKCHFFAAVLLNDKYVVSGNGKPGLSNTYPSPLEKSPITYKLYLTPDHLPQTEELFISGPVTDKIHIQVQHLDYIFVTGPLLFVNVSNNHCYLGVSEIWTRVWRPYQSKYLIPVLLRRCFSGKSFKGQMVHYHICLLSNLWHR